MLCQKQSRMVCFIKRRTLRPSTGKTCLVDYLVRMQGSYPILSFRFFAEKRKELSFSYSSFRCQLYHILTIELQHAVREGCKEQGLL